MLDGFSLTADAPLNSLVKPSTAGRCYGGSLILKEERLASTNPRRSALHEKLLEEFQAEEQNSGMEWASIPLLM